MDINLVFEEVLPYISDPIAIKEFIENNHGKDVNELMDEINRILPESEGALKTDLRILLNALLKFK